MYNANSFYSIINTANPKPINCYYFFFWSSSHFNASLLLVTKKPWFPWAHLLMFFSNLAWLLRGCCNVHSFSDFQRIPSLMSNPNYFFNFYFDETRQLIDSIQFDRFFPQLLFVILTCFDFTDFFHDYFL